MPFTQNPLTPFTDPSSIALFGASPEPGSIGHGLLCNLRDGGYGGAVHLISNRHTRIGDLPCHASLDSISQPITLALIATPAATIPHIIDACERHGVLGAVIYSAALGSAARQTGQALAEHLRKVVQRGRLRIFGPRAFGFILPHRRLNLTPIVRAVPAGNLALISQSTALCAHILDWHHNDEFGFSAIFAPGHSADLELPEILDHVARDPKTESILLYIEGVRDARRFLSAARAAASIKPVIAIKAGHQPVSSAIAEAHSGAPVGRDDALDAALRRAGVLRVGTIGEMFSAARALTTPRKPHGRNLAIVCNGGGPAVIAADQAGVYDIALNAPQSSTLARLAAVSQQSGWGSANPFDLMFDATPQRYADAIDACLDDPGIDGVLVIFAPTTYADSLGVARSTIAAAHRTAKPVLACWLGEDQARSARAALAQAGVPAFRTPENAVTAFAFMATWVHNQALLQETPAALTEYAAPDTAAARAIITAALQEGRERLTRPEAKAVLAAFHIPVTRTLKAITPGEAVAIADSLGYPLAMRSVPLPGTSAADFQQRARLRSAPELVLAFRELTAQQGARKAVHIEAHIDRTHARELSIQIRPDRALGPVITLSEAGIAPEIYDARAVALPPLNARLVDEMLGVAHVAKLLGPLRDKPAVALGPVRDVLLRVSELASELPCVHALDIISLVAGAEGAVATDVAIEVRATVPEGEPYRHMAICPYPARFVFEATLKDESRCTIRPIRPEDACMLQAFVRGLSMMSKRFRYFSTLQELPRYQLARATQIDYGRELTLVATRRQEDQTVIVGEAHYATLMDRKTCEFAVVIADDLSGKGLGSLLMRRLMEAARLQGLASIRGEVLADNEPMLALMESLDFVIRLTDDETVVEAAREL